MAEIIVNLVLGKLADSVFQEDLLLHGVADEAESVKRELIWIRAFLKDADSKCHKDERVKQWVSDVKEVAHMIEDALDIYLLEADATSKEIGVLGTLKRIPKMLKSKHNLGAEIGTIQARISEIKDFKTNYGMLELKESTCSRVPVRHLVQQLMIPEIDEEIIGFEEDMKKIIEQLTDGSISRRYVLSIVGQGGLGKTTLAKQVYRSETVKHHFNCRIWLPISSEFDLTVLLKKLLENFKETDSDMCEKGPEYLIVELNKLLKEEKYLIVLDDVWENQSDRLLNAIHLAFPNANNGSRVLITTRFVNVAKKFDPSINPYKLTCLNEEESKKLLLKKACPYDDCPDNLLPLAEQFAKKCAGLPLALVVLGGQLSMKDPDYHNWDRVMQKMDWCREGGACMDVISTSYDDLPAHLKPCFMYLALFPEDYTFEAKTVTWLWIAEGFIAQDENITMENTAENYLEELVQRCMIQVSKKSSLGKIKRFHWHDLLRELAIKKAKEENILKVHSNTRINSTSNSTLERRVALQFCGAEETENLRSNLRSLLSFGVDVPNCGRFKLLRVLSLQKYSKLIGDYKWLAGSTTLRYLELNSNNDMDLSCLANLKNLQTFVISISYHTRYDCNKYHYRHGLPEAFWNSKMLRHVKLPLSLFRVQLGPPSSAELRNLVTLQMVEARKEWSTKLPCFPHLRQLQIYAFEKGFLWEHFTQLLGNLKDLESLLVSSLVMPIHITPGFAKCERLQCLDMYGQWPRGTTIRFNMLPPNLVKLALHGAKLEEDPLPQLEKLPHLKVLELFNSYLGRSMTCFKEGFCSLQKLKILSYDSEPVLVEEWNIEEGAMPVLNQLQLWCFHKLEMVPNFQHLTNLRQFTARWMSPQFKLRLEGEDQYKVRNIQSVYVTSNQEEASL